MMKNIVIIPARLNSTRFPGKILHKINGLPMVEHVRRRALFSKNIDEVFIATGDKEIVNELKKYKANIIFTKQEHDNGTSRITEAVKNIACKNVILVQGDEPLILPIDIENISMKIEKNESFNIINAISNLKLEKELNDQNIVKCSVIKNKIIYCFRKSPAISSFEIQQKYIFKLLGLIAFKKDSLIELENLKNTIIQDTESIEQMKLVELGVKINTLELKENQPSINTFQDLIEYDNYLNDSPEQKSILLKSLNYCDFS